MKKLTDQEWKDFQERVKQVSTWERTHRINYFSITFNVWKHTDSSISLQKDSGGYYKVPIVHNTDNVEGVWWKWDKEEDFRKLKRQLFITNEEWKSFCFKMYYLKPFTDREWEIFNYLMHTTRSEFSLGVKHVPLYHFHPTREHFTPIINSLKWKEEKKKIHDRNRIVGLLFISSILFLIVFIRIFLL
jgi:hypothetical protein